MSLYNIISNEPIHDAVWALSIGIVLVLSYTNGWDNP